MKLKIQTRMVYGRPLHYPLCETGKLLVKLGRGEGARLTFSERDIPVLLKLGYEIEQISQFGEK